MTTPDISNALDMNSASELRRGLASGSADATRKVAQQFEGMFLNMVLKSMREALPHTDPTESDATRMATSMYDSQIAQNLATGKGTGLADALVRQMERAHVNQPAPGTGTTAISTQARVQAAIPLHAVEAAGRPWHGNSAVHHALPNRTVPGVLPGAPPSGSSAPANAAAGPSSSASAVHGEFVEKFHDAASAASEASGIPTKVILGQAALESGWGRHEVRDAQGNGSYNLFGIKAGSDWKGPTVEASTTEFVNGVAQRVVQKFRAYASYADSFLDYAKMVASNPRYAQAAQVAHDALGFARAMGSSGYATDPAYANKLASVLTGPLKDIA